MPEFNTLNFYSYGKYKQHGKKLSTEVAILTPAFGIGHNWNIEKMLLDERNHRFDNDCWILMLMWDLVCIAQIILKRKKIQIMYDYSYFGFQINASQHLYPKTLGGINPRSVFFGVHHHGITYRKFVIGKHFMYETNYPKEQHFNIHIIWKYFRCVFITNGHC